MAKGNGLSQFADSMATAREPIELPYKDGTVTFFVRELGYLETQNLYAQARLEAKSALGLLVSETVEDKDGNRFTYEEAMKLRKEIAEPLFGKVGEVNRLGKHASKN